MMNRTELIEHVERLYHYAKKVTYGDIRNSGDIEKFLSLLGLNPYLFNEFSVDDDEYVLGDKFSDTIQRIKNGEKITEEMSDEIIWLQKLVVDLGIFNVEKKLDFCDFKNPIKSEDIPVHLVDEMPEKTSNAYEEYPVCLYFNKTEFLYGDFASCDVYVFTGDNWSNNYKDYNIEDLNLLYTHWIYLKDLWKILE